MTYHIIATGSSGNAVLLNDSILIDCGVPFKKLEPYIKDLRLVLLTHAHGDHFKPSTARALQRVHPVGPLGSTMRWGCCEWMAGPLLEAGVDKRAIDVIEPTPPGKSSRAMCYNNIAIVSPVPIPHNVPNCGWEIYHGHESLFYATDCSSLDGVYAENFDLYMIEANHTRAEIEARIAAKLAAGEFAYEEQAMHNHLSQEQALDWLAANMGPNSQYAFLHQHQEKEKPT